MFPHVEVLERMRDLLLLSIKVWGFYKILFPIIKSARAQNQKWILYLCMLYNEGPHTFWRQHTYWLQYSPLPRLHSVPTSPWREALTSVHHVVQQFHGQQRYWASGLSEVKTRRLNQLHVVWVAVTSTQAATEHPFMLAGVAVASFLEGMVKGLSIGAS